MREILSEYPSIIGPVLGAVVTIISVKATFNHNNKKMLDQKRLDVMPFLDITMENLPLDSWGNEQYVANECAIIYDDKAVVHHMDPNFISYKVSELNVRKTMKSRVKAVTIKNIGANTALGVMVKKIIEKEIKLSNKTNLCVDETYKAIWLFREEKNDSNYNIILEFADLFGNVYNQIIMFNVNFDENGYGIHHFSGISNPPNLVEKSNSKKENKFKF